MLDFQCAPSHAGPQIKTEPDKVAAAESSVALLSSLSSHLGLNAPSVNQHSSNNNNNNNSTRQQHHNKPRQTASSPGYHSAASSPGSQLANSPASSSSGCFPTTSGSPASSTASGGGGSRSPMSANLLDYFPDMNQDGLGVSWFHDANSRAQLSAALLSNKIIVAGDVSLAEMSRYPVPIMARPPLGISDITLEHWLQQLGQAPTQHAIKLTFTSTRTVEPAFRVLARHAELLKGPVILNADILARPSVGAGLAASNTAHHRAASSDQHNSSDQQPVDAWTFLMLCRTRFPKSIISIGWCSSPSADSSSSSSSSPSSSSMADSSSGASHCSLHSTTTTTTTTTSAATPAKVGPPQPMNSSSADPMFELELLNEASAHLGQLQQQLHQHFHPYSPFVAPAANRLANQQQQQQQVISQSTTNGSNLLHHQLLSRHHHNQLNHHHHHHHHHHILSSTGSLNSSSGNSSGSPSPTSPGSSHLQLHSPAATAGLQQPSATDLISKLGQQQQHHSPAPGSHHESSTTPATSLSSAAEQLLMAAAVVSQADLHHHHTSANSASSTTSSTQSEAAAAAAMAAAVMAASNFHHHQQLPMNLNINEAIGAPSRHGSASQLAHRLKSSASSYLQPHNLTTHHNSLVSHLSNGKRHAAAADHLEPTPKHHHSQQQQQQLLLKTATNNNGHLQQGSNSGPASAGYTREMIDKMASLVKEYNLTQPVTFPVEARLLRNSLGELQRLLYQVGANSTLTVVAQQEDLISVDDLLTIRKAFASNQVLFDLPDNLAASLRHELDLL